MVGESKIKPSPFLQNKNSVVKYISELHLVLQELGNLALRMATQADQVCFIQAWIEERGPQDIARLPRKVHSAAPLLNYTRYHRVTISMPRDMDDRELDRTVNYGYHNTALKYKSFISKELAEQLWAGQTSIIPLSKVQHFNGLWLSPLAAITQTRRKLRLIYDFSWIWLNAKVLQTSPKEDTRSDRYLHIILDCIVESNPQPGPTF